MSPALSGSSAQKCIKLGDALGIRDGIIFDFYSGLPHVVTVSMWYKLDTHVLPIL